MTKISHTNVPDPRSALIQEVNLLFQQGFQFHRLGQLSKANAKYEQVLLRSPKHFDALHLTGVIAIQEERPAEALAFFDRAIKIDSNNVEILSNKALALMNLKRYEDAITCLNRAISKKNNYVTAYYNRGIALVELDKLEEAVVSFKQAISFAPNSADPYNNLGSALTQLGRLDEAIASYESAIAIAPNYADAYSNIANPLLELGKINQALLYLDKAIALDPNNAVAYSNRGNAFMQLGLPENALENYSKATSLAPSYAEAHSNKGRAFAELNQNLKAIECYDQAIALDPLYSVAHLNKGESYAKLGLGQDALDCFDLAQKLNPGFIAAQWNKSIILLLNGDFTNGLPLYELRWKTSELKMKSRNFSKPLWLGEESLTGKTILLHSEQGFGDTIQFCRYAKMVRNLGAKVILEVPLPLVDLLRCLDGVDELIPKDSELSDFDFHCPLLSLPLAFKTDLSSIPNTPHYLYSNQDKRKYWLNKLGASSKKRIGIVWSGSLGHSNDRNRSLLLKDIIEYLPINFEYISLQKEIREVDQAILSGSSIRHFGPELQDFSDTAAICDLMDLVISVDTSVAHLAAALGKPTWILLPFTPDWRWHLDREDSPWYPSVRLFRQSSNQQWSPVIQRVAHNLQHLSTSP